MTDFSRLPGRAGRADLSEKSLGPKKPIEADLNKWALPASSCAHGRRYTLFPSEIITPRYSHILFECNSLNDVGSARDLCLSRGVPVAIDLGCHMNDHMVSFYMGNPSNFALEYGWSGRTIDPASWQAEHYTAFDSIWGHAQLRDMVAGLAPGKK